MTDEQLCAELTRRIRATGIRHGLLDCPKCGRRIRFEVDANNATRGRCATRDCLEWKKL